MFTQPLILLIDDDHEERSPTIRSCVSTDSSKEFVASIFKFSTFSRPRNCHVKDKGDISLRCVRNIPPKETVAHLKRPTFYENFKSLLSLGFLP